MNESLARQSHPATIPILGDRSFKAQILSSGESSRAWRVFCDQDEFIVRTPLPDSKRPISYRSEHRVLDALHGKGQPVPLPFSVGLNRALHALADVTTWSITRPVAGKTLGSTSMSRQTAVQLGQLLQTLHALPCTGYGLLDEDESYPNLRGQQLTPVGGMRDRWCWAALWPFDHSALSKHVVARLAPELLDDLLQIQANLWAIASDFRRVINHSDLHGEHIFVEDGRLSGVIDFGAAFIAGPGWDFAVLAYYHGWKTTLMVLDGYEPYIVQRRELLQQARYLAIVVALYKLEEAVNLLPTAQSLKRIIAFIMDTLLSLGEHELY